MNTFFLLLKEKLKIHHFCVPPRKVWIQKIQKILEKYSISSLKQLPFSGERKTTFQIRYAKRTERVMFLCGY